MSVSTNFFIFYPLDFVLKYLEKCSYYFQSLFYTRIQKFTVDFEGYFPSICGAS